MERFLKTPNRIYLRQLSMPRNYCEENEVFQPALIDLRFSGVPLKDPVVGQIRRPWFLRRNLGREVRKSTEKYV
jgi:hypothetical protein